jgi:hypothetical protein
VSRVILAIDISEPLRLITPVKTSIVAWVSSKLGLDEIVVLAPLVPPVMVSPEVKVPDGTVTVIVVEVGFVIMEAVTALVPPVMVSPTLRLPESPTVAVIVPTGYSDIPEATVWLTCLIVQRFKPRLAQSENNKLRDLRAVAES